MHASDVILAATRDHLVGIAPLVVGLVVVVALIVAVGYGIRLRQKGDARPSGPTPPHPKEPVGYEDGRREPDDLPRNGSRLLPHEIKGNAGSKESDDDERPKWDEGSSGAFGSGGPGRH